MAGDGEGSRQRFRGLAKGTGDRYPDRVLSAEAKGWEWPRVQSVEDELGALRRRAKLLGKLRFLTARYGRPDSGEAGDKATAAASARARAS
ncbi:MAG: conjugative transfer protein MobI(A/C) [Acidiferrobacteraceae bacterium]